MLIAAVTLQGCSNDDPELPGEDEIEYPVPEIPENDVVTTKMDAKTCVMTTNLDDVGALFVKRLENTGTELTDETELLILDDEACNKFVKDEEEYNRISYYYFRGGIIYIHKPAMGTANLMARLQYGMSPVVSDETIDPVAEAYICHVSGAEYWGGAAWEQDAHEHTYYDEEGNEYKESCDGDEKPTEYYYGRYAESSAKFINEVVNNLVRSNATTVRSRAGTTQLAPEKIPITYTVPYHGLVTYHLKQDKVLECMIPRDYQFYVETAYSFDQDKDFYSIHYSQSIPVSQAFKGHFSFKRKMAYYDKYGGFNFFKHHVEVELCNYKPGVSIYSLDGVLPKNEPLNGQEATVKGWNISGNVSFGTGLMFGLTEGYNSSTTITVPYKDIPVVYQQKRKDLLRWEYKASSWMNYYSNRGRNGGYKAGPKICEQDITFEQGWGWIVSNTKQQGDTPLKLRVNTGTGLTSGACTSGAGGNSHWNFYQYEEDERWFKLPVPERFRNKYDIVASPLNDESVRLRQLFTQNSDKFKYIIDNPDRCAVTDEVLERKMKQEWQEVLDQLRSRGTISNVKEDVTFYLEDSSGKRVLLGGYANGYGIRVTKNGEVKATH